MITLRRITLLERADPENQPIGNWPDEMEHDEWEAIAEPMQRALCDATQGHLDEIAPPAPVTTGKPPRRKAPKADSEPTVPTGTAIQQYLKANREREAAALVAPALGTPAWLTTYLNNQ